MYGNRSEQIRGLDKSELARLLAAYDSGQEAHDGT